MTPCEKKGYKVGDEFVVSNPRTSKAHRAGVRVRLFEDDGTGSPYFEAVFKKDRDGIPVWVFDLKEVSPVGTQKAITRTNGQPFATEASARQQLTAKGLQGTHEVVSHEGGYALAPISRTDERVALKAGDYVSTEGMTEDQYDKIVELMRNLGANDYCAYPSHAGRNGHFLMWDDENDIDAGPSIHYCSGRHLTIDQVLGATNAGNATPQPEESTMTTDPITTLKQARQARDDADKSYQRALEGAREHLGEGFELTEVGTDGPLVDGEDMTDPANWREGDVVECVESGCDLTVGKFYAVKNVMGPTGIRLVCDDNDDYPVRMPQKFRSHHRPA